MKSKILLSSVVSFWFLTGSCYATSPDGAGSTAAPFLKIPISARAAAMGNAFTAVSGDIATIEFNPAGLSQIDRADINASFIGYLEDTSLQSLAVGFPIRYGNTKPAGNAPKKIFMGLQYRLFQGDDTARNELGHKLDDFQVNNQLVHAALAHPLTARTTLGIAGKFISQQIQEDSANTYAFDAGLLFDMNERFSFGAAVQNGGPSQAVLNDDESLPLLAKVGAAYKPNRFLLVAEVGAGQDSETQQAAGIEWEAARVLRIRAGALHNTILQLSGGIGIQFALNSQKSTPPPAPTSTPDDQLTLESTSDVASASEPTGSEMVIGVDYALRNHEELGITHNVTLRILY